MEKEKKEAKLVSFKNQTMGRAHRPKFKAQTDYAGRAGYRFRPISSL
jgi:hypothetical protein